MAMAMAIGKFSAPRFVKAAATHFKGQSIIFEISLIFRTDQASGLMLKSEFSTRDIPHEALRKSLRVIFEGGAYLTPAIAKKILSLFSDASLMDKIVKVKERFKDILTARTAEKEKNTDYKLTKTQFIVLEKIVQGKSTEEIAAEMNVTENTVNTHIKAIFRELEVHSRAKAIRKAIEEKIIHLKA